MQRPSLHFLFSLAAILFLVPHQTVAQKSIYKVKTASIQPIEYMGIDTRGLNTAATIQEVVNKDWFLLDDLEEGTWDKDDYIRNDRDLGSELPPLLRPHIISTETQPGAFFIPREIRSPHCMKTDGHGRLFIGYELLPSGNLLLENGMATPHLPPKSLHPLINPKIFEDANLLLAFLKREMAKNKLFMDIGSDSYALRILTLTPREGHRDFMFIVGHPADKKGGSLFLAHTLLARWPSLPAQLHSKKIKFYRKEQHLSGLITLKHSLNDKLLAFMNKNIRSTRFSASPQARELIDLVRSSQASGQG